jgi:VWFA-related protein
MSGGLAISILKNQILETVHSPMSNDQADAFAALRSTLRLLLFHVNVNLDATERCGRDPMSSDLSLHSCAVPRVWLASAPIRHSSLTPTFSARKPRPLEVGFSDGPLAFIAAAVSELRSMPGRKIIVLLADGINNACPEHRSRFEDRLRRLTDLAARSSSIIYALQTRAFSSGVRMPDQRDDVTGPLSATIVHNEISEWMKKLAEPTGGYADRSNSISELMTAAVKDAGSYYVLAYQPPAGTFTNGKVRYRRVEVRVSRRGAIVRTRAGFYSIADSELIPK